MVFIIICGAQYTRKYSPFVRMDRNEKLSDTGYPDMVARETSL